MKGFKKLVLTSAILAASSSALAMQAMDDESMSLATGQDGLTITLDTNVTTSIKWVDRDGTGVSGFDNAGALVINNIGISTTGLVIDIDAGGNAGTGAGSNGMLNIGVTNTSPIVIDLSGTTISAADAVNTPSGGWTTETLADRSATGTNRAVIGFSAGSTLTLAASSGRMMDIQLGSEVDNFVTLNGNLGTITLTGLNIYDGSSGASIGVGTVTVEGVNLVNASVNVVAGGLQIGTGTGLTNMSVGLERVTLGATPAMGDVYLTGLSLANNTITVAGK